MTYSVVIPAHDEESVIRRCLDFVTGLVPGEAEVVVVANGCTDGTARVAAGVPGVTVLDLPPIGKSGALNAGDAVVTALPRVYLDADIVVSTETVRRLASALDGPGARVAAPRPVFELGGRPWSVRSFYRVYLRLPYVQQGLTGLGVYAVSAAGRARFTHFPELTADDLFTQRLFAPHERLVIDDTFTIQTPRSLAALLAVRTRVAFGNRQLAEQHPQEQFAESGGSTGRALVELVRADPWLAPAAVVYVAVVALARRRATRSGAATWQRDRTTR
ncbi:MAG TPA: glycosyltransferase family 2 protein [Actinomycetales bacterium]